MDEKSMGEFTFVKIFMDTKQETLPEGSMEFFGYKSEGNCGGSGTTEKNGVFYDKKSKCFMAEHMTQFGYRNGKVSVNVEAEVNSDAAKELMWKRFFANFVFYLMIIMDFYLVATLVA